jgi:Glycogen recognition site of AMP-activated protein kinase
MLKNTRRAKNASAKTVTAKPEPAMPQPSQSPAIKPEPVKLNPLKLDAVKVETARPEAVKPAPGKPETAKAEPVKPENARPVQPKSSHVSLDLVKPDAKTVCVAGSFNEWKPEKTPLSRLGNGHWHGDLAVKPGRHEYLFVVDGQWVPDPNAKETVQNPFGGKNSVLVVSE